MEITLQEHTIIINATPKELKRPWLLDFITAVEEEILFLSRSVWVYHTPGRAEAKKTFLTQACKHFAKQEQLNERFFIKAILCCVHYPIKLAVSQNSKTAATLKVSVATLPDHRVSLTLDDNNIWYQSYIRTKLTGYLVAQEQRTFIIDTRDLEAKQSLQKTVQREKLLHMKISYTFETDFLRKLFDSITAFEAEKQHYYRVLGCSHRTSVNELKSRYKKLAKTYHPDKIIHTDDEKKVLFYTQKFQELQEAYHALKGA